MPSFNSQLGLYQLLDLLERTQPFPLKEDSNADGPDVFFEAPSSPSKVVKEPFNFNQFTKLIEDNELKSDDVENSEDAEEHTIDDSGLFDEEMTKFTGLTCNTQNNSEQKDIISFLYSQVSRLQSYIQSLDAENRKLRQSIDVANATIDKQAKDIAEYKKKEVINKEKLEMVLAFVREKLRDKSLVQRLEMVDLERRVLSRVNAKSNTHLEAEIVPAVNGNTQNTNETKTGHKTTSTQTDLSLPEHGTDGTEYLKRQLAESKDILDEMSDLLIMSVFGE